MINAAFLKYCSQLVSNVVPKLVAHIISGKLNQIPKIHSKEITLTAITYANMKYKNNVILHLKVFRDFLDR